MPDEPKLITVYRLAHKLMKEYELDAKGWTFEFSNKKKLVGTCYHDKQLLEFSKHYIDNTPLDEIENTIRHEIAHALVGPGHGHDYYWRNMAMVVGARPERCANETAKLNNKVAKGNYIIRCPSCGRTWRRFRLKEAVKSATHCGVRVVVHRVINE